MDSRTPHHTIFWAFVALLPLLLGGVCAIGPGATEESRQVVVRRLLDDIINDYLPVTPFATFTPTPAATFTPSATPTPTPTPAGGDGAGGSGQPGEGAAPGGAPPGDNLPPGVTDTPAPQPTATGTATLIPTPTPPPTLTPSATLLPTLTPLPTNTTAPPATSGPDRATATPLPDNTPAPTLTPTPTFTVVPPVVSFGAANYPAPENIGSVTITVVLDKASPGNVSIHYATANGTAFAPDDYAPRAGTLIFEPGQTSQTFNITIVDDVVDDPDAEQLQLTLSAPVNATLGSQSSATITIQDNEALPVIQFSSASYAVPENGAPTFTLVLDQPSGKNVSFTYAPTSGGSATEMLDYAPLITARILSPGVDGVGPVLASLPWPALLDDALPEPDETVVIELSGVTNATLGAIYTTTLTILNDD